MPNNDDNSANDKGDDSAETPNSLKARIRELEGELVDRERDLAVFREELAKANIQLERFIKQISTELRMASTIQKALVPTEFPNIPGFEFSTKFVASPVSGGDYFDIFEHEDRFRFGIVLASSSGYSMSALFLSVLLRMTGQLEARKGTPANQILELMGKELLPNIQGAEQASVFYAVIDRRGFDITYAGAGRVIGLLYSYQNQKVQKLEWSTPAFSREFKADIEATTLPLGARDRLILCTEGVVQALNPKGEEFGEERLFKAILAAPRLGVHDLRNEILYQVERFAAGRDLPHDATVVVTEVKDRVIKLAKS